jgi:hypothetical protein
MTLKPGHVNVIFSEDYFTVKTVIETIALYRVPDWGSTTRKAAEITAGEVHIQGFIDYLLVLPILGYL